MKRIYNFLLRFLVFVGKISIYVTTRFTSYYIYEARFPNIIIQGTIRAKNPDDALFRIKSQFLSWGYTDDDIKFTKVKKYDVDLKF